MASVLFTLVVISGMLWRLQVVTAPCDRYKVLSLLFQAGWKHMLLFWAISVVAAALLSRFHVLPMPFHIVPDFLEYHELYCPFFPWCLLMAFLGSCFGLLLAPYSPSLCGHPVCFLDVVSIHQVDRRV